VTAADAALMILRARPRDKCGEWNGGHGRVPICYVSFASAM
jgi:hypothetical protein